MPRKPKTNKKKKKRLRPPPSPVDTSALDVDVTMVRRYLNAHFVTPISQLRDLAEDESVNAGESMIINSMLRIRDTGDVYALNALLDRLIGPVLRRIHVTGERPYEEWTIEQLEAEARRLNEMNRVTIDMVHKERKLIGLVESGEIKPGEYTEVKEVKETKSAVSGENATPEYVARGTAKDKTSKTS